MKTAIYDLSVMPTTYDFAAWVVLARSNGCEHVHFVADRGMAKHKYTETLGWRRFGNILVPLCAIAGMTYSVGTMRDGMEFTYHYGHVNNHFKMHGTISKLKATYDLGDRGYSTITLRESFRNTWRNANVKAWTEFRKFLESEGRRVIVLPECELSPLDVEYRMALYQNADMNYGASNGPMALCHLSDAPYMTINMCPPNNTGKGYDLVKLMAAGGFPVGTQFEFKNDRQLLVYESDDYENIVRAHNQLMLNDEKVAA
jgi:hypothetical protein